MSQRNQAGVVHASSQETITVYTEPFNTTERCLIYQEPETPEVQATIDEQLRTGKAAIIDIERSNGTGGFQSLPSYCQRSWPNCLSCTCNQSS